MRGGHAKNNKIKEREGPSVYRCICGSIMRKATLEWVTKQKTPSENNCSRGFFRIFVDLLSVERNHSLKEVASTIGRVLVAERSKESGVVL